MPSTDGEPRVRPLPNDRIEVSIADCRHLLSGTCPHRKGRMVFGYVNVRTGRITCPLHHSTFDLRTGESVAGPTELPIQVWSDRDGGDS